VQQTRELVILSDVKKVTCYYYHKTQRSMSLFSILLVSLTAKENTETTWNTPKRNNSTTKLIPVLFNHIKLFQVHKDKTRFFQVLETQREGQLHLAKKATNLASQTLNRTQVPGSPTPGNKCLTNSKKKLAKHIQSVHKNFKNQKENTTYLAPCFFWGSKLSQSSSTWAFPWNSSPPHIGWSLLFQA
jgi:hypothetical protein